MVAIALPAAISATTWGGAPAGATARPSVPTAATGVGAGTAVVAGAGVLAAGAGVCWDACALPAVPPVGEPV
jgi:hypothetical protein